MPSLITGGTGFLGAALARALLAEGETVVLMDRTLKPVWGLEDAIRVQGDVGVEADVTRAFAAAPRLDTVYHFAAYLSSEAEADGDGAVQANVQGTRYVLRAAHQAGARRVVFASSAAVYGPGVLQPVNEDVPLWPLSAYGSTKAFGEMWGRYTANRTGMDFRALRFASVVGPGRSSTGAASIYSTLMIERPALGQPYVINVPPTAPVTITYIKDAVDAMLLLARHPAPPSVAYNVAVFATTAQALADAVRAEIPDADLTFDADPAVASVVARWPGNYDGSRLRRELGWQPRYDLPALIRDFIAEVRAQQRETP